VPETADRRVCAMGDGTACHRDGYFNLRRHGPTPDCSYGRAWVQSQFFCCTLNKRNRTAVSRTVLPIRGLVEAIGYRPISILLTILMLTVPWFRNPVVNPAMVGLVLFSPLALVSRLRLARAFLCMATGYTGGYLAIIDIIWLRPFCCTVILR